MNIEKKQYKISFIMPALIMYGLFFLVPSVISMCFSFTDWSNMSSNTRPITFTGLQNFKLLFEDESFMAAAVNTPLFTVVTCITKTGVGLILALILNKGLKTANFIKTVFFFPTILSFMVVGLIFTAILKPAGPFDEMLKFIGMGALIKNWLTDMNLALWTIMAVETWKFSGLSMVIFLAGLSSISTEYVEASVIDGANSFQKFRHIIMPLLMPSVTINIINNLIGGLKIFDIVYIMTNFGPANATQVFSGFVYSKFGGGAYGMGTAGTLLQTVLIAVIAMMTSNFLRKREVEM